MRLLLAEDEKEMSAALSAILTIRDTMSMPSMTARLPSKKPCPSPMTV